jgi:hypothetical protein
MRIAGNAPVNPEAEAFFLSRQAHDEVGTCFRESLRKLGEYEVLGDIRSFGAPYAVTAQVVFGGASDLSFVYYRLNARDRDIAFRTGGETTPIGPDWVRLELFRAHWPQVDLKHWSLRAYDFARTGK